MSDKRCVMSGLMQSTHHVSFIVHRSSLKKHDSTVSIYSLRSENCAERSD